MRSAMVSVLLLFCLLGLLAAGVTAQGPVDDILLCHVMPDLRAAPAPGWVRPGSRITYYSAAAVIPSGRHHYIEDERGGWTDPSTGKRYRQDEIPGAAPAVFPISVTLERTHVGSNWGRYVQHTQAPGFNPPVARVFGSAQFGSGHVLDQDRVTGVVTSVGQIGRVSLVGSSFRLDHLYDRQSGVLACLSRVEADLRYEIRLAGRQ